MPGEHREAPVPDVAGDLAQEVAHFGEDVRSGNNVLELVKKCYEELEISSG
ncbi:MAG: hypothetical protein M3518_08980 [Actinomycetota bacterium]|nr:hypothetical protein [Actinomycetota bacterium]